VELTISTGSGNIHLTHGSGNQIHIYGKVHSSNWNGDNEERVREIAANPPIEQTGNIIRIGKRHEENWHNISIDYEIQAPADSFLTADSGSGDVTVEEWATMPSSPPAPAHPRHRLHGSFSVSTGSGDIVAEQTARAT